MPAAVASQCVEATIPNVPLSSGRVVNVIARHGSLPPPMAAELIDGSAIAQQVRAEVRDDVAAWTAAGHERARAWRPCWSATTRRRRSTSAASRRRRAEVGIRGFDHRLAHDAAHERGRGAAAPSSTPTRRSRGSCCSCRRRRRSTAPR